MTSGRVDGESARACTYPDRGLGRHEERVVGWRGHVEHPKLERRRVNLLLHDGRCQQEAGEREHDRDAA